MIDNTLTSISTLMTREMITVSPITLLRDIHEIFQAHHIHHIPVVDENMKLHGIVSFTDYAKALDTFTIFGTRRGETHNEKSFKSIMAKDIMEKKPVCLSPEDKIGTAVGIFKENLFHAIPIIKSEKLVGLITTYDLLVYAYREPTFID